MGKKNKKAGKKNKKAAKKNKKAGKKNKKAEKKQKKAGKKQKKSGRKLKKRKQQKTGRKAKMNRKQKQASGTRSASSCLNFTCIDKAIGYLNMHKGKVANFKKQNSRVARQNKTSTSKSGKKGLFGPVVRRITHMGGGNASDLTCHGKKNAGAAQLTNLTETLLKCEDEIHNNCHPSNMPQPNMTKHAPCLEAIETFENKSNGCIKKTGSEACTCWEDKDLAAAAAVIKKCDLSSDANNFKTALKKCTSSFGKCRKYEDDVAAAIHACNLDDKVLVKKLKNLNTNKNALSKLQETINSATNSSRFVASLVRSSGRALSCSVVITTTETVVSLVTQNPTSYSIFTLIQTVVTATFTCTESEKTSLKASGTKVATAITVVSLEITHVQTSYAAINGKEATDSEIDAADTCKTEDECDGLVEIDTTTAPTTAPATAPVTDPTKAPTPAPASESAAPPPASTEAPASAPASTAAPSEGETSAPMPASTAAASAGETPVPVPTSTAAAPASETPVALPASTPSSEATQAPSKAPETTAPAPVSTPQMTTRRGRQHIQHIMRKRMVETLI